MPKIIESARRRLLQAAREQIAQNGYAKTTMRSMAAATDVAVGTVYNYFPSKDILIASFVSEDWHECVAAMETCSVGDARTLCEGIFNQLRAFSEKNRPLFSDPEAARIYNAAFSQRHKQLRQQLAWLIEPLCGDGDDRAFLASFIAEALLSWTREGEPFENIYQIIQKLI